MTLTIRNMTEADFYEANQILNLAFGTTDSRIDDLRRYLALQPDGWFYGLLDGRPAATVGAIDFGPFAWIGFMAVHPELQKKGIGHEIMRSLLSWLERRGCDMALLDATEAGRRIYLKLGFSDHSQCFQYILENFPKSSYQFGHVTRLEGKDISTLGKFDERIYGANRECVFRILIQDYPERAFITRDEFGKITGYLFAQRQKIGPWVAGNHRDAEMLLNAALSLEYENGPRIIIPEENQAGIELITRTGFTFQKSHTHMRRGGLTHPGDRSQIYGQASYGIG